MERFVWLSVLSALALNLLLLLLSYFPEPRLVVGDEKYYLMRALDLADGRESTWYYPYWPPLYAHIIAGLFSLFGASRLPLQLMQIAMWLGSALLWYGIAARLGASRLAARGTLVGMLLLPELIAFSHYAWPETLHLFLFALALWLPLRFPGRLAAAAGSGLFLGLCLLAKMLLLYFVPVLVLFVAVRGQPGLRWRTALAGAMAAVMLLTILPTLIAHKRGYGCWMLADSGLLIAWHGLTSANVPAYLDRTMGIDAQEYINSAGRMAERHELYKGKLRRLVEERGVTGLARSQITKQYFRLFTHRSVFTIQLPGGPKEAYRFGSPVLACLLRAWSYACYGLVLGLGMLGMVLVREERRGWWQLARVFFLYYLAVFLVAHAGPRYRLQLMPFLVIFAAVAVHWLWLNYRGKARRDDLTHLKPGRTRLYAALGLVALAELVAFAYAF